MTDDAAGPATGPAPRAAAGRVAAVHRQTRRSLMVVVGFVGAAVVSALLDADHGRWMALHLFLVGALLSGISAGTVFLSVTWSAAPPPPDRAVEAQRWMLAAGAIGLAATRRLGGPGWTTGVAGAVVVAALVVLGVSLLGVRRTATVDRFFPAIDAYLVAIALGAGGSGLGGLLAAGVFEGSSARIREAHLGLNLFGLVGIVVAGTLPYMMATQARTKMSPRATPGAIWATVTTLSAASLVTLLGRLSGDDRLAAAGLGVYAITVVGLVRILPSVHRRQFDWAGPRLVQLLSGILWWALSTAVLAWRSYSGDGDPGPAMLALVIGGYAQILTASLAYLGPVVRGGGHVRLGAGFALTRSWIAPLAGNVAAAAAILEAAPVMSVAIAVWGADLLVRTGVFVARGRRQVAPSGNDHDRKAER